MALYHLNVSIVQRSKGQASTEKDAYVMRCEINDERIGKKFNYSNHKDKAIYTNRFLPDKYPDFAKTSTYIKNGRELIDYGGLWNTVETNEKRKDSQLARRFIIAAQKEFTVEENIQCFKEWVEVNFTSKGYIMDGALHEGHIDEDGLNNCNLHLHGLAPLRPVNQNGFEEKKDPYIDTGAYLMEIRQSWADIVNNMFKLKFMEKHKKELEELEEEYEESIPDKEDRKKECVELLYDKYPSEWIYISEKRLDEQRDEVEEWIEQEEEKECVNLKRIERFENKFLSIPFEAQKHLGAAKNMQRRKEKTDRTLYAPGVEDPLEKNKELAQALKNVKVTRKEAEESLQDDPAYKELMKQKEQIIKIAEKNIQDVDEVKKIKDDLSKITTQKQFDVWKKETWIPIETRIRHSAERNAAYDDIKKDDSIIVEAYKKAPLEDEFTIKQQSAINERLKSIQKFKADEMDKDFCDSENQQTELSDTVAEMTLFQKISSKFKQALTFVKEKAAEIIEKSPLMSFRIFREQRKLVEDWKPGKQISEVEKIGQSVDSRNDSGKHGSDGKKAGTDSEAIDFNTGVERFIAGSNSRRSESSVSDDKTGRRKTSGQSEDHGKNKNRMSASFEADSGEQRINGGSDRSGSDENKGHENHGTSRKSHKGRGR